MEYPWGDLDGCELATTHLINASARSNTSLSRAFQESFQRSVRNEQPTCGNFVTTQTAVQSSNVGDTVAGDVGPGPYFFDSCGVGRSVRSGPSTLDSRARP